MSKWYLLGIVLVALCITGCSQQEEDREEEVKELVTSFIGAYNNGSAEKLYSMLSDGVKANYSVESTKELVDHTDDLQLNVTGFNLRGDRVVVNTSVHHHEEGWATIVFCITYNDSEPKICNNPIHRIEEIDRFAGLQGVATPIPTGYVYHQFVEQYNLRIWTEIYSLLSDEVKANHSLGEVRDELEFGREHDIKLYFNESEFRGELLGTETKSKEMPTTMKSDKGKFNCSVKVVFKGKFIEEELDNSSLSWKSTHTTTIDSWVFKELNKCYNLEQ